MRNRLPVLHRCNKRCPASESSGIDQILPNVYDLVIIFQVLLVQALQDARREIEHILTNNCIRSFYANTNLLRRHLLHFHL